MISKKNLVIFIFLLSALISCSNEFSKYNYVSYKKLENPRKAKKLSSVILVNKEKINLLSNFNIVDKYIVTIDMKSDKLIKIFNNETGKLLKSFGRKGQGPSEFIGASDIIRDPNDENMFWIYDLTTTLIKKFSLKNVFNDNFKPIKIIKFTDEIPVQIVMTKNNHMYATAITTRGRILEYDEKGRLIRRIGKIPLKFKNRRFAKQHSHGFLGDILYLKNKLYIATKYGSLIENYDIKSGKLIATYYGPDLFFPEYNIVPAGIYYTMTPNKKTRWGYVGISHNKKTDKFFLLYSGRYFFDKEGIPVEGSYTNTIYIMNNKGELEEELILDKKVHKIRVSEDSSTIYGAGSNEILKFEYIKKSY